MCGAFGGRDQNRVGPITDLTSERIEIRQGRWLRVVHYKPCLSTSADSGFSRENSFNSVSSATKAVIQTIRESLLYFSSTEQVEVLIFGMNSCYTFAKRDTRWWHLTCQDMGKVQRREILQITNSQNCLVIQSFYLIATTRREMSQLDIHMGKFPTPMTIHY